MPSCSSIDPLVTPYIDGELAPADRALLEEHLRRCAPCRSRVVAEQSVRELMRERKPVLCREHAPAILRSHCAAAARFNVAAKVHGHDGATGVVPVKGWTAWLAPIGAAASLVVIVGGAFLYQATARSSHLLAAELAADHMKCFAMNAVLGTQQSADAVQSSMASSFGWNMRLPLGSEREGLELVGSRPCLYGEGRIAHIMYRHNGQPLSLFMLPRTERPEELVETLGHECVIWSAADRTFVLVSRETRADVERLAAYVHASMRDPATAR
jgi:anti-sigma factor RsiW